MTLALIVGTDSQVLAASKEILEDAGARVVEASSAAQALETFRATNFEVVLASLDLEGELDGLQLLVALKRFKPDIPVLILSPYPDIAYAARSARLGAFDYIEIPVTESRLREAVSSALAGKVVQQDELVPFLARFLARSAKSIEVVRDVARYARQSGSDVLISGETGTGKEVCARLIHEQSDRRGELFIAENCAAIAKNLEESELFGHERGAFTGADRQHIGAFERARGGTLFLDEIEELSPDLQAKLLRVIEHRCFRRVGGEKELQFQGRIVYASNRHLADMVARRLFRDDLYHRISIHQINIPPLRERPEDIVPLAEHFLRIHGKDSVFRLSSAVEVLLRSYSFPGNVRELEGFILYALPRCQGLELLPRHLPLFRMSLVESAGEPQSNITNLLDVPHAEAVDRLEKEFNREYLPRVLKACNHNLTRAAQKANLDPKTFRKKWTECGLGHLSTR